MSSNGLLFYLIPFIHLESFLEPQKILWAFLQVAILDGMTMGCGSGISLTGMFSVVTDKTVCDFFRWSLDLLLTSS